MQGMGYHHLFISQHSNQLIENQPIICLSIEMTLNLKDF